VFKSTTTKAVEEPPTTALEEVLFMINDLPEDNINFPAVRVKTPDASMTQSDELIVTPAELLIVKFLIPPLMTVPVTCAMLPL
jgi:hypothetical protein